MDYAEAWIAERRRVRRCIFLYIYIVIKYLCFRICPIGSGQFDIGASQPSADLVGSDSMTQNSAYSDLQALTLVIVVSPE